MGSLLQLLSLILICNINDNSYSVFLIALVAYNITLSLLTIRCILSCILVCSTRILYRVGSLRRDRLTRYTNTLFYWIKLLYCFPCSTKHLLLSSFLFYAFLVFIQANRILRFTCGSTRRRTGPGAYTRTRKRE